MTEEYIVDIVELPDTPENRATYYITEYIDGKPSRVFRVVNPVFGEPMWYRSTASISAFRRRQNHTHYEKFYVKGKVMPLRYSTKDAFDYSQFEQFMKASIERNGKQYNEEVPIEAGTVFDFYKLISYDHKTNKFVKKE